MKRVIKVLMATAIMAVILVVSISPAMALRRPGGVLLEQTTAPCDAPENAQEASIELDPPERAQGCWVLLPSNAP